MKKILISLAAVCLSILMAPFVVKAQVDDANLAGGVDQNFVCSAYYSPLPGQSRYATGSYAGDIRLNGSGVRGASGKPVFPGMVAAPREFPFGTKMFIPGIGMTEVADRGGAIRGNRLDIWFGYGDEALVNALNFGKRPCLVTVYGMNDSLLTSVSINGGKSSYANLAENPFKFKDELQVGDSGESVARLQQFLKDLGYLKGSVNANFDESTKSALLEFQRFNLSINNDNSNYEPGVFGVATIMAFEKAIIGNREKLSLKVPERNFGRGAMGADVELLQKALKILGYDLVANGIYDQEMVNVVLKFQLDEGIIASSSEIGAGYFGPKTQARLDKLMLAFDEKSTVAIGEEMKTILVNEKNKTTYDLNQFVSIDYSSLLGLKIGSRGDSVLVLQKLLKDRGYFNVEPTGYFGPLTANALFKFKKDLGLVKYLNEPSSRIFDQKLLDKLNNDSFGTDSGVSIELNSQLKDNDVYALKAYLGGVDRTLELGVKGDDVKKLQQYLKESGYFNGAYTTDYFGASTKAALMRWQIDKGLIKSLLDPNAGRIVNL